MAQEGNFIIVSCPNPNCRQRMRFSAGLAGKRGLCPVKSCRAVISIPPLAEPDPEPIEIEILDADEPEPEEVEFEILDDEPPARRGGAKLKKVRPRRRKRRKREREAEEEGRRSLDADQIAARTRAAGLLFCIAALQIICGGVAFMFIQSLPIGLTDGQKTYILVEWLSIAGIFVGLGAWACFQPLPACALGLLAYILLSIYTLAINPVFSLPGFVLRGMIILALAKALHFAWEAR
jgi:hypothetical protein